MILVSDKAKAEAIKAIVNDKVEMGNITVTITILDPNENGIDDVIANISAYETVFSGNSIFSKIALVSVGGAAFDYCIFFYKIVQFRNDDMSELRQL